MMYASQDFNWGHFMIVEDFYLYFQSSFFCCNIYVIFIDVPGYHFFFFKTGAEELIENDEHMVREAAQHLLFHF